MSEQSVAVFQSTIDGQPKTWTLFLTLVNVETILDETGANLYESILSWGEKDSPLVDVISDALFVHKAVWILCRDQHEGVTREQFLTSLSTETDYSKMREAWLDAIANFSVVVTGKPLLRNAISRMKETMEKVQESGAILVEKAVSEVEESLLQAASGSTQSISGGVSADAPSEAS